MHWRVTKSACFPLLSRGDNGDFQTITDEFHQTMIDAFATTGRFEVDPLGRQHASTVLHIYQWHVRSMRSLRSLRSLLFSRKVFYRSSSLSSLGSIRSARPRRSRSLSLLLLYAVPSCLAVISLPSLSDCIQVRVRSISRSLRSLLCCFNPH